MPLSNKNPSFRSLLWKWEWRKCNWGVLTWTQSWGYKMLRRPFLRIWRTSEAYNQWLPKGKSKLCKISDNCSRWQLQRVARRTVRLHRWTYSFFESIYVIMSQEKKCHRWTLASFHFSLSEQVALCWIVSLMNRNQHRVTTTCLINCSVKHGRRSIKGVVTLNLLQNLASSFQRATHARLSSRSYYRHNILID